MPEQIKPYIAAFFIGVCIGLLLSNIYSTWSRGKFSKDPVFSWQRLSFMLGSGIINTIAWAIVWNIFRPLLLKAHLL